MEYKFRPWIPPNNLEKQSWRTHFSWFKNSLQSNSNQDSLVLAWEYYQTGEWSIIETPEVNPYIVNQLIFQNSYQENPIQEKIIFSTNGTRTTIYPHTKDWSLDPFLYLSECIINLWKRHKLLIRKHRGNHHDLKLHNAFLKYDTIPTPVWLSG